MKHFLKINLAIALIVLVSTQITFAQDFISPLDFNYEEVMATEKAARDYADLKANGATWQKTFLAKIDTVSTKTYTTVNGTIKSAITRIEAFEAKKILAMSGQYDTLTLRILTTKVLDDIAATLDMEQSLSKKSTAADFQKVLTAWKNLRTSFNFKQLKEYLS